MKASEIIGKHVLIGDDWVTIDLNKSQGSYVVDAVTGKTYLDCFSQFASQPLGWNHPEVNGQISRLGRAALHKVANSDMLTNEFADFVNEFSKHTQDFHYHFYIDGGALAVENALKAAFDWKMKRMNVDIHNSMKILHLKNAFHGRSGYTMSLTNSGVPTNPKVWGYPKFTWPRIDPPTLVFNKDSIDAKRSLSDIEKEIKYTVANNTVAAMIVEPIQGEGGDNHFSSGFFGLLRNMADEHDFLLIFDEVQTGVGLTGKFWCYEHFGVVPDLMCFGKKTQVCGVCATDRMDEIEQHVFNTPGRINSTWGGNFTDMVRATILFQIIEKNGYVDNAAEVGEYFLEQLRSVYRLGSHHLKNVRGRGLMIAFDLENTNERNKAIARMAGNGLLVLACGDKGIRFRPHLDFTKAHVDDAMERISDSIQ